MIIAWETDQYQLTAEDSPASPLKVRENASFLSVMLKQRLPSAKLQGPKALQVTYVYKGTQEDTHACVHAVFPLRCTPAVRLTKVGPGLNFTWNRKFHSFPFLTFCLSIFTQVQTP